MDGDESRTPRQRLYTSIVQMTRTGLERYYKEHPDRLGDARSFDAAEWSMRGIQRILAEIDKYEVMDREGR